MEPPHWYMGMEYDTAGPWQRTPWWLFWRKPWRRKTRNGLQFWPEDSAWQYCDHEDFLKE